MHRLLRKSLILSPNTNSGKTVFSTLLSRASVNNGEHVFYLKPVSTGSADDADQEHLKRHGPSGDKMSIDTLWQFANPVSPHLAPSLQSEKSPSDNDVIKRIKEYIEKCYGQTKSNSALYIETAGGVHSPGLSGNSQLDIFKPLRPPVILIASHELGGISTTRSAYESIVSRGYDIDAVVCFKEDYYRNWEYFRDFFNDRKIPIGIVPPPPNRLSSTEADQQSMQYYYNEIIEQQQKQKQEQEQSVNTINDIVSQLRTKHDERITNLETLPGRARDNIWWAFAQHGLIKHDSDVTVVDSASGDFYNAYRPPAPQQEPKEQLLTPFLDAPASWWTQCLGHGNPELILAGSYAAGRYGHVIFPHIAHEPAMNLTQRLLDTVGKGWADRVFFADDGSTGMEAAMKMGLKSLVKRKYPAASGADKKPVELGILGLKGSYHGDTIGAMDASAPSHYSKSVEWYRGRGFWLDPPVVNYSNGKAQVTLEGQQWQDSTNGAIDKTFSYESMNHLYDVQTRLETDPLTQVYWNHFERTLSKANVPLGCLILEPIVLGAAGMVFVDPLFQRVLVDFVRSSSLFNPNGDQYSRESWSGLPVLFDEVFTGLYRLGHDMASKILGVKPDIACFAKILSGGLSPLSVVLANESIFNSFLSDKKEDALLHGHSYTAYPMGCEIANKTLEIITDMDSRGEWNHAKSDWQSAQKSTTGLLQHSQTADQSPIFSFWGNEFVNNISKHPTVDGVMTLGTVLSIYLKEPPNSDGGYQSSAAASFMKIASKPASNGHAIFARPIGNALYFMTNLNTTPEMMKELETAIKEKLDEAATMDGYM